MGRQCIRRFLVLLMRPPSILCHLSEGDHAGAGQQHHGIEFDQIGQNRGIFHRRAGIGTEKSAAVGAQVFDDFQCGHRTHGDHLEGSLQSLHHDVAGKVLGHALPDQKQAAHQREGQ